MSSRCPLCHRPGYVPDEVVRAIRDGYAAGAAQADLATQHNVSEPFVSKVLTGQSRLDAGGPIREARRYTRRTTRGQQ